jgi:uncharacterized FlaG/YvyC family protein
MNTLSSNYQIGLADVRFRQQSNDDLQRQKPGEPRVEVANPGTAAVSEILAKLNAKLPTSAMSLRFFIDETTGKTVFRLIDTSSGKTMRQIPNEQALATIRALDQARGWLLNSKL